MRASSTTQFSYACLCVKREGRREGKREIVQLGNKINTQINNLMNKRTLFMTNGDENNYREQKRDL